MVKIILVLALSFVLISISTSAPASNVNESVQLQKQESSKFQIKSEDDIGKEKKLLIAVITKLGTALKAYIKMKSTDGLKNFIAQVDTIIDLIIDGLQEYLIDCIKDTTFSNMMSIMLGMEIQQLSVIDFINLLGVDKQTIVDTAQDFTQKVSASQPVQSIKEKTTNAVGRLSAIGGFRETGKPVVVAKTTAKSKQSEDDNDFLWESEQTNLIKEDARSSLAQTNSQSSTSGSEIKAAWSAKENIVKEAAIAQPKKYQTADSNLLETEKESAKKKQSPFVSSPSSAKISDHKEAKGQSSNYDDFSSSLNDFDFQV